MLLVFTVISFCFRFPQMSSPLPRYWVNMSAFACFVWPPTCINYVDSCLRLSARLWLQPTDRTAAPSHWWQLHGCPEKSKTEITQTNESEKVLNQQIPSEKQSTNTNLYAVFSFTKLTSSLLYLTSCLQGVQHGNQLPGQIHMQNSRKTKTAQCQSPQNLC